MADCFFRGTAGNTNWSDTANWYATSAFGTHLNRLPLDTEKAIFTDYALGMTDCIIDNSVLCVCGILEIQTSYVNNIIFNANLTVKGNVTLGSNCTLSGTGGTLIVNNTASFTSNSKTVPCNLQFNASGKKITLIDNAAVTGNFLCDGGTTVDGGKSMDVSGSYTQDTDLIAGFDLTVVMKGTGTLGTNGKILRGNVTIQGLITTLASFIYYGGTLLYTSGSVVTSGATPILNSGTFNAAGINWTDLTMASVAGAIPITLANTMNVNGSLSINNTTGTVTLTSGVINLNGGLTVPNLTSGLIKGSTVLNLKNGTLYMTPSATGHISTPITTSGNITLSGTIRVGNGGTWTHGEGTLIPESSTVYVYPSGYTFYSNANGFNFNTLTLNTSTTFSGTQGCVIKNLTSDSNLTTLTHTFKAGQTYRVNNNINLYGLSGIYPVILKSDSAGSSTYLNLNNLATQNLRCVQATDIDSSGGRRIMSYSGTLTRTNNWELWTTDNGGAIYKTLSFLKPGYNYRLSIAGTKTTNSNLFITNSVTTLSGVYGTIASGVTNFNSQFSFTPITDSVLTLRLDKFNSTATLTTLLLEKL